MKNAIEIDGRKATVVFDPEIRMFRGEFVELAGSADFYATHVDQLLAEGRQSLDVFLAICAEKGIEPFRTSTSPKSYPPRAVNNSALH